MWRRARWLMLLTLLIPGSAQLVAGNRKLARVALFLTLLAWASIALFGLIYLVNRGWFLSIIATPWLDSVASVIFSFTAFFYALITLDTLRLVKLGRLTGAARWVSLSALLVLAIFGSSIAATGAKVATQEGQLISKVFERGGFTAQADGRYNILMLGGDAGSDRFGLRPDSISVLSINANTGQTLNIGIPRNMQRVNFVAGSPMRQIYPDGWSCGIDCLINAIYKDVTDNHADAYPNAVNQGSSAGVEATREAVEWVTGLKIQSYILVDMSGFERLINALGGVNINVKYRLPVGGGEDIYGQPINVRRWIEPGYQHLNGKYALWYARARHGTSDYARMARQREVINAIVQQSDAANLLTRLEKIARAGEKLIKTDIPSPMLGQYVDLALKAKAIGLKPIELVPPEFDMIHPDFTAIRAKINQALVAESVAP